jgi:hypothetical protein
MIFLKHIKITNYLISNQLVKYLSPVLPVLCNFISEQA